MPGDLFPEDDYPGDKGPGDKGPGDDPGDDNDDNKDDEDFLDTLGELEPSMAVLNNLALTMNRLSHSAHRSNESCCVPQFKIQTLSMAPNQKSFRHF